MNALILNTVLGIALATQLAIVIGAMVSGTEQPLVEGLATLSALAGALAYAFRYGGINALPSSAVATGLIVLASGLLVQSFDADRFRVAGLPLVSEGFYVLLFGCTIAAWAVVRNAWHASRWQADRSSDSESNSTPNDLSTPPRSQSRP